jgi:UDP-glucose 4-epimerase
MKALVTGGMGFIGSHLTEKLLAEGHQVKVIDDLSTGHRENLAHLEDNDRLTCYVDTIRNKALMEKLLADSEVVFHLAAVVGVQAVLQAPLRCIDTNIRGTDMLLELAHKHGAKVLLASSSEVYGKNLGGPFREEDNRLLGPTTVTRWIYSTTKAVDECLALSYWREKQLPVVVMRFFNIVGPRQTSRYGMVLPTFVQQALADLPITVYGDGQQIRSFTYVSDAVRAVTALAVSEGAEGGIFNVGSGEITTIAGLAERVKVLLASNSNIEFIPYEMAYGDGFEDTQIRIPDISKLRRQIGYTPEYRMDDMIHNIADYFRQRKSPVPVREAACLEAAPTGED